MHRILKTSLKILFYTFLVFLGSSLFFVILYRFVNPPVTPLMILRCGEQLFSGEKIILKKNWVDIDEISPDLPLAVVASEDNLFFSHHGFDLESIKKASEFNEKHKGKRLKGASTISQQTAKNVFLWPQRSWVRKGFEAYFTVLIEFFWSKKRILEVYLNVIETGNGIYGAEAACQNYFNRPSSKLTRSQSALLAAILPNPRKWDPNHPTPFLAGRQSWILWNMQNIGKLDY